MGKDPRSPAQMQWKGSGPLQGCTSGTFLHGPGMGCRQAGLFPLWAIPGGWCWECCPGSWHPMHSTLGAAPSPPTPCPTRASSYHADGSEAQRESPARAWQLQGATSPRCDISPHRNAVWRQARQTQLALKSPMSYSGGVCGVNKWRTRETDTALLQQRGCAGRPAQGCGDAGAQRGPELCTSSPEVPGGECVRPTHRHSQKHSGSG